MQVQPICVLLQTLHVVFVDVGHALSLHSKAARKESCILFCVCHKSERPNQPRVLLNSIPPAHLLTCSVPPVLATHLNDSRVKTTQSGTAAGPRGSPAQQRHGGQPRRVHGFSSLEHAQTLLRETRTRRSRRRPRRRRTPHRDK